MLLGIPLETAEAKRLADTFPEYFLPDGMPQTVSHSMLCRRYIVLNAYAATEPTKMALAAFGLGVEVLPYQTVRRYAVAYQRRPAHYHGLTTDKPYLIDLHIVPHTHQKGGYLVLYEKADADEQEIWIALVSSRRIECGR